MWRLSLFSGDPLTLYRTTHSVHKVLALMRYTESVRLTLLPILLILGCGLRPLLPRGPAVRGNDLRTFESAEQSPAEYTGDPKVVFPVVPLQAFGLQYAVDVVYVSSNENWDMHEYARLDLPEESVWIAKDSDQQGRQTIVSERANLERWMPEIPAPRIQAPIGLIDRSDGRAIDVELSYTNPTGEHVEIRAKGKMPKKPPAKRNGSTMGHSKDVVAAVLDIERFGSRVRGSMAFDGEPTPFKRIFGIVPFRFLLQQTQAGLVITNFRQIQSDDGFELVRPSPAEPDWPTVSQEGWQITQQTAQYDNGINLFLYTYTNGGLSRITIRQHGVDHPTFEMHLQPALPDVRRTFDGTHRSSFLMDVNGQRGHGTGYVDVKWEGTQSVTIDVTPTAPWWLADRPMQSTIRFNDDGSVDVRTVRVADRG